MKLATFTAGGPAQLGVVAGGSITPLNQAAPRLPSEMIGLIAAWPAVEAARAREAGKDARIRYSIAKEGAIMFFDMLAIPADARHVRNAHLFIDYLLRADVAARNSSTEHYATSNAAAYPLIDPAVYADRSIYPAPAQKAHLYPNPVHSLQYTRELNRTWTRFKTGR